jgi:hypothetical protein
MHRAGLHGAARPETGAHNIFAPFSEPLTTASAKAGKATDTKHHYSTIQVSTKLLQLQQLGRIDTTVAHDQPAASFERKNRQGPAYWFFGLSEALHAGQ